VLVNTPSRPPADLARCLEALTEKANSIPEQWSDLRDATVAHLFLALASGDLGAVERTRDAIQRLQGFIDRNRPERPAAEVAATELSALLYLCQVGTEVLEPARVESSAKQVHDTTRKVLDALRRLGDAASRGEVHKRLPESGRPTPARVSQILDDLTRLGLAIRLLVEQGERVTAHYRISPAGEELCRRLGLAGSASNLDRLPATVKIGQRRVSPSELIGLVPETFPRWGT
jgi:hypothetical protein